MNYRELGHRHEGQYPAGTSIVDAVASALKRRGFLPKRFFEATAKPPASPEVSFEAEWKDKFKQYLRESVNH